MGGAEPQLEYHLGIALNIGVPPGQIVETIVFLSLFIGFARTLNAALREARVRFAGPAAREDIGDRRACLVGLSK